jgi:hypothetical protein
MGLAQFLRFLGGCLRCLPDSPPGFGFAAPGERARPIEVAATHSNFIVEMVECGDGRDARVNGSVVLFRSNTSLSGVGSSVRRFDRLPNSAKRHFAVAPGVRRENALFRAPAAQTDAGPVECSRNRHSGHGKPAAKKNQRSCVPPVIL